MKKLGCVNAAITCTLQDARGNVLGTTIDTPNAIAYAMAKNKKIARAVAHYQYFGERNKSGRTFALGLTAPARKDRETITL